MANVTFEAAANRNDGSIRKALKGLVMVAPFDSTSPVTTLVATGGQINVPTGFNSVGWITEDGASENGSLDTSELRAWGSATPVRRDITGADASITFTMMEDNRFARELYDSLDLSAATVSAAGELKYDIQAQPDIRYYRVIVLGLDGSGATRRYFGSTYHKVSVTDRDDLVSANGDSAYARGVTLSALPDDDLATLGTRFAFGPGLLARAVEEGYVLGS